jgi:hypothetical protein
MHACSGSKIWGMEPALAAVVETSCDDHTPIYALHCLSIYVPQKLISNEFIEKVHVCFLYLVDNLSFKVGKPHHPGNSLRKHVV